MTVSNTTDTNQTSEVLQGDCLELMRDIPDGSVDCVITSPPYNMNLRIRNGKYCSRQIVKEFSTKYVGFADNIPIDEYYDFHSRALAEMLRVSELVFYNIQIVTGSKRAFFRMIGDFSDNLKDIIVWDKVNAQPAMGAGILNRQSELLLVFDGRNAISRKFESAQFKRGTLSDVWRIKRGKKIANTHGAVFPVELVETILSNFTKEGDTIFDPFAGSGTTGVACQNLNRNFILIEQEPEYVEIIKRRLDDNSRRQKGYPS